MSTSDRTCTAKLRLQEDTYEEFRMILADWLWNTVVTRFEVTKPEKHYIDLEDVYTMLGETIDKIIEKQKEDVKSARSEGKKDGKKEGKKEVAIDMLKEGVGVEFISRVTKIPMSDLKEMQVQL